MSLATPFFVIALLFGCAAVFEAIYGEAGEFERKAPAPPRDWVQIVTHAAASAGFGLAGWCAL